jgi:hypothetical protein
MCSLRRCGTTRQLVISSVTHWGRTSSTEPVKSTEFDPSGDWGEGSLVLPGPRVGLSRLRFSVQLPVSGGASTSVAGRSNGTLSVRGGGGSGAD